jgi:hypothetical protein
MRVIIASAFIGLALTVSSAANAQAPAGSTGECKDGTYTTAESKKGACGSHGGVKEWFGSTAPAKASTTPATTAAAKSSAPAVAATAPVPSGSTGQCKDGTYTSAESKKGACGGHGGVKDWYGSATSTKTSAASEAATPAAAKASTTPMAPATPAPSAKASTAPMAAAPAAGGGPGQVWVNTKSKVYHCPGTEWYGKTKAGEYMTESAAKAAGNHADHGKACS